MQGSLQGVVEQVSRKPNGATNIKVNGTWYGCGFKGIPCNQGDNISFTATANGKYFNIDSSTIQVLQSGGAGNAQNSQQGNTGNAGGGGSGSGNRAAGGNGSSPRSGGYRKDLTDPVQVSITQQSARNAAIQFLDSALKNDAIPLPSKKGERMDALLDLMETVEERFYARTVEVAKSGGYPNNFKEPAQAAQTQQNVGAQQGAAAPNDQFDDDIPFN